MIDLKTPEELEIMVFGGKILSDVLYEVVNHAKPGVTELELDTLAETLIRERGGEPGFQKVPGYHHTICTSVNDVVVHGIPSNYKLRSGDIIGIDCGVFYKGLHTDMSETVVVGKADKKVHDFLENGKRAVLEAIEVSILGNHVGDISKKIQEVVEKQGGYSVVRSLIGHGVGRELHEDPEVPGYVTGSISKTPELVVGITIAIEAIYNMGKRDVVYASDDGWTIKTKDDSLSGVFERTIAITQSGPLMITP